MKRSLTTNLKSSDVLFLDANVLFSAAYRENAGLLALWNLEDVTLVSSNYAAEEARRNLMEKDQRDRLESLLRSVKLMEQITSPVPLKIDLPEKDRPILTAAIAASATHLITGDFSDFGRYYGRMIQGVTILAPAAYLRGR